MVWFPPISSTSGLDCNCRTFSVSESTGSFEICAEILFINGTALTTTNYTVTVHTNGLIGSARSKLVCFKYLLGSLLENTSSSLYYYLCRLM